MQLKQTTKNGVILWAKRSNITLTLPKITDTADITVINTALQQIQTAINNLTTECNNSIKYVSETDDYVEVQKDSKNF